MTNVSALEPVPDEKRTLGGFDFALLWVGAGVSLAAAFTGGFLVPLGFWGGLAAILGGHVIGNIALAWGHRLGAIRGVPTMVGLRAPFGAFGSYLATGLNVIQLVGWTAVMLIVASQAVGALFPDAGETLRVAVILTAGVLSTAWGFLGRRIWRIIQRVAVVMLSALTLWTTLRFVLDGGLSAIVGIGSTGEMNLGLGFDLVIAFPISWLPLVMDYGRLQKRGKRGGVGTYVGFLVGSAWLFAIGHWLAMGGIEPVVGFVLLGFGVPSLIIVLLSTITTTFMDIYSTAVSFQNFTPRFSTDKLVVAAGLISTAIAVFFPVHEYESFLLLIGSVFVPLGAVLLADSLLSGRLIPTRAAYNVSIRWTAVVVWVLGVALFHVLAKWTSIGASIPTFLATGALYVIVELVTRNRS
jgi:NCS1 family nucleobase:cation symporter-1